MIRGLWSSWCSWSLPQQTSRHKKCVYMCVCMCVYARRMVCVCLCMCWSSWCNWSLPQQTSRHKKYVYMCYMCVYACVETTGAISRFVMWRQDTRSMYACVFVCVFTQDVCIHVGICVFMDALRQLVQLIAATDRFVLVQLIASSCDVRTQEVRVCLPCMITTHTHTHTNTILRHLFSLCRVLT
jgi:hypothetical protein